MKVPERFIITLRGRTEHVVARENVQAGIAFPLTALLTGSGDIRLELLRSWGIDLDIQEDIERLEPWEDPMCNLYRLRSSAGEVARIYKATLPAEFDWKPEIYPRYTAPVVIAHQGERRVGPMAWGFPTQVQGKTKVLTKHVTNARNLASPFWKGAAANPARRCLVPFTQFAEPRAGKDASGRPAQWWFTIADQPVACFAGLWRPTEDGPAFAFCTTEPNALVAPLHPKAMPVILMPDDQDRWLTGGYDDVLALQAPYPSQLMAVE